MLCLTNSKHVLCEKAFTVNAAQLKKLIEVAKKKQLFLMEAVWTRYFPAAVEIRERINRWDIGEVKRVSADLSVGNGEDIGRRWDNENRMVSMKLAGGALLDRTYPHLSSNSSLNNQVLRTQYSRYLLPNLAFPSPIPHNSPRIPTPTESFFHRNSLRSNRRR